MEINAAQRETQRSMEPARGHIAAEADKRKPSPEEVRKQAAKEEAVRKEDLAAEEERGVGRRFNAVG